MTTVIDQPVITAPDIQLGDLTAKDVAALAAEYIELHGWFQGALGDCSGKVCTLGAAAKIFGASFEEDGSGFIGSPFVHRQLRDFEVEFATYLENVHRVFPSIPDWNDNVCESQEQVVETLRAYAAS